MADTDTMVEHRLDTEGANPLMLAGVNDRNMHDLGRLFSVRVVMRGSQLVLKGPLDSVERAVPVVQHMIELSRLRAPFDTPDIAEQSKLLNEVADLVDTGHIKSTATEVAGKIDAATLREVHAQIESGTSRGKIVLEGF